MIKRLSGETYPSHIMVRALQDDGLWGYKYYIDITGLCSWIISKYTYLSEIEAFEMGGKALHKCISNHIKSKKEISDPDQELIGEFFENIKL